MLFTAIGGTATAQTLDICVDTGGSGDRCDCATGPSGYDACDEEALGDLVGPDDPDALRAAASIGTEWVGDDLHVFIDLSDLDAAVLPVPSNDGEWESESELNAYLSDLFDTTIDLSDEDLRFVINQKGALARWDTSNTQWASNQLSGSLVWSTITSAEGKIRVEDDVYKLDESLDCDTETDVDFSGTQCTTITELTYDVCVGTCGPDGNVHDRFAGFVYRAESILTDFELSTGPYLRFDATFDFGSSEWHFRRMQVLASEADMENLYYDPSGSFLKKSPDYPSTEFDTDATSSSHTGADFRGACGFGEAVRLTREITPKTTEGTAPWVPTCEWQRSQ